MSGLSDFLTQGNAPWWTTLASAVVGAGLTYAFSRASESCKFGREDRQRWDMQLRELTAKFIGVSWSRISVRKSIRTNRQLLIEALPLDDRQRIDHRTTWSSEERVRLTPVLQQLQNLEGLADEVNIASNMAYAELSIIAPESVRKAAADLREKSQAAAKADRTQSTAADEAFRASRENLASVVRDELKVR